MKTQIFSKLLPVAVFVLGISGAFLTTSMQHANAGKKPLPFGYIHGPDGPCSIAVNCSDFGTQVCRVNGTTGTQAKGMDSPTTCNQTLWRPQP